MPNQPGRNDPCPCGSGKKYKKCCMDSSDKINPAREVREELEDLLENHVFDSIEEANLFAKEYIEKRNNIALEDFHGLSPDAMHRLLYYPFESPKVIQFNFNSIMKPDDAPLIHLLYLMAEAIGEEGLKPTATGNLPRAVSREIAKKYLSEEVYNNLTKFGNFMSENDIPDLNEVRKVAELAGFIHKYRGKFVVAKICKKLIQSNAWAQIYEQLFHTFIEKFNWAYLSRGIEIPFLQHSFAFTLYLLRKYGNESRSPDFYAGIFVNAFPMFCEGLPDDEIFSSEEMIKHAYCSQVMYSFGKIAGFVEYKHSYPSSSVRALPLLYNLVTFTCFM